MQAEAIDRHAGAVLALRARFVFRGGKRFDRRRSRGKGAGGEGGMRAGRAAVMDRPKGGVADALER